MKRNIVFAAALALFLMAAGASAQEKAANFAGHWELDTAKSKLDERARIQAMTLDVVQTDKDIKVESKTTRAPRPEGDAGGTGGGRGMGRGGFGGGDSAYTYSLDGKETTVQQDSPMGQIPVTLKAKADGGKLNLSSSRTFNGPNGEISISSKETWSLSDGGKTLTVEREQSSPRGTNSSTLVFVKK
jgi:hypothetical protein